MATIEQLKQALVLADQAGDFENASVLAAAIKQQMEAEKAQIVPLKPGEVIPVKKEYSLMDKLLGGPEVSAALVTGATTGTLGYFRGLGEGVYNAIEKGNFGTQKGAKEIIETADKRMAQWTYEPKSEVAKEMLQDIGEMAAPFDALAMFPQAGAIERFAEAGIPVAKQMVKPVITQTQKVAKPIVEVTKPIVEKTKKVFKKELPTKPDEVATTIYEASKGDEKAKKIIQEIAPLDEEALKAAERLDIDLPIDIYLRNDETARTVGLSRSQVGSAEEMAFKHDIINTSQVADEALSQLGKVTSIAEVSDDVKSALQASRNKLKEQEKILYQSFDETLPPEQTIAADNLFDLLNKTAVELGGEARLTATEKQLLALSKAENLTYGALLRAKNDIGSAVGGQKTLFPDVNDFQLKKIYEAIKEDQKAAVSLFGGEDQLANLKLANTLTVKRKAIENNIIQGYGRKGEGSIAGLINRAITAGSKGDVAPLDKLLSVVPVEMHKDVVATALKDLSISKKAVNLGEFDFNNYAKTYEGLRKNAPVYSKIINILGTDKAQMLQDLYAISKKIVEAKSNVLHTGKANQAIIAGLKGNTIMQNIVGKIIGWGTSKISAGLISPDFMFKTPQDKLQAIADLMRNPDFKQMIIEASKGKASTKTINKVMATDAYKKASVGESTEPIIVEEVKPTTKEEVKEAVKEKNTAKKEEKSKPTKEEIKAKVEEKKAEKEGKKKVITPENEATTLYKEVKNNKNLDAYKSLIVDEGGAKTKGERNKSHNWFDVPVEDEFGQTVATKRIAGQRDITEAFTADKASIDRFMKGKATVEDLKAIKHDLNTFELSSDLRDEASILRANKSNKSVELSDGSIYDPFSKMSYSKKEWQDLMDEAMFSKSPAEQSRLEEWHKDSAPETKNEDGTPKVFYHGTGADFDTFRKGERAGALGKGIYFADNPSRAGGYTSINGRQENIMPVYLNMKKPFMVESIYKIPSVTALKKEKYDGIIWHSKGADGKVYSEYVVFNPNQIKSVFNKGTYSESNPNILMSKGKAFNSVLKDAIDSMPNKMDTEAFKSYLKGKGVKDDEINFSGIKDILDKPTVTKQEVLKAFNSPMLEKKVLGNDELVNEYNRLYDLIAENPEKYPRGSETYNKWLELKDRLSTEQIGANATKFEAYKTPNVGTNYREVLTTIGDKLSKKESDRLSYLQDRENKDLLTSSENIEYENLVSKYRDIKQFKSSHWDEPNVLYHTRLQDVNMVNKWDALKKVENAQQKATDYVSKLKKEAQDKGIPYSKYITPEMEEVYRGLVNDVKTKKAKLDAAEAGKGEKTLLVEEIQSDWHQEGRKQGYKDTLSPKDLDEYDSLLEARRNPLEEFTVQQQARLNELEKRVMTTVPQAPYSKTWHEKAMKDIIDEAVKNGYDRVAWTVGKTQADRYSLRKQVNNIFMSEAPNGNLRLDINIKNGNSISKEFTEEGLNLLPDYVGKEMADKILADRKKGFVEKSYSGLDLEVGGEGMKGFYDKILPDFTNKYIKKYGSKVEKKTLSNGDEVWSFEVTDKMKEDISGKGQSLFSQFKTKNATTKQEAQTIAQNLLGKHYAKHADTFEIVQSVEDLPQNIKDALYSVEAYHGSIKERTKIGADTFFTNKPEYAEQYAGKDTRYYPAKQKSEVYFMTGGQIYPAKIELDNFKTVTKAETKHDPKVEQAIISKAKADGYDGLIIKYEGTPREDYVPFNDNVVKLKFDAEILKSGGKARGIFDPKSGKAYIIADAMKANEVEGVILHELLHKNINNEVKAGKSRAEAIMGSRYESVVKRLDNLYKMGDKQVKDAFQKVTDANTPVQHRIEEVMTYLLENITNESKPLLIKWKDDVIAAIKAFIAKTALQLGMKAETVMSKLDSKDIANILRSEAIKNESMLKNIKR